MVATNLSTTLTTELSTSASSVSALTGDAPLDISGCAAWWDPSSGYDEDVGVYIWTDRVGAYDVLNLVGANQPVYNSTGPWASGRPSLSTTKASTQYLSGAAGLAALLDGNAPYTVALCLQYAAVGTTDGVIGWDSASNILAGLWKHSGDSQRHRYRDAAGNFQVTGTGTATVDTDTWVVMTHDGVDTIRIKTSYGAETTATGASAKTVVADDFKIGQLAGLGFCTVHFGDIAVWTSDLGASGTDDRNTLETWLAARMSTA